MKYLLVLPLLLLTGCIKNYRVCVISTTTGYNCTHPVSKDAAKGIAEYVSAFDQDSVTFVIKKGDKKAKGAHAIDPAPETLPGIDKPEPSFKELPRAPVHKEGLPL